MYMNERQWQIYKVHSLIIISYPKILLNTKAIAATLAHDMKCEDKCDRSTNSKVNSNISWLHWGVRELIPMSAS